MKTPEYDAEQAADGTWTIKSVPIFAEVPKGQRSNEEHIGSGWMKRAIEKARQREKEGYTPPLHIHHHGTEKTTSRAGSFTLRRVGTVTHDGKKIAALFADLTGVPDYEYQRIRAGELPYRSVEVFNWDEPEINSLALLDDEVPFFRFPNLRIGRERPHDANSLFPDSGPLPVGSPGVGFVAGRQGAAYLFRFQNQESETMSSATVEERLAALEAELASFKSKAQEDEDKKEDMECDPDDEKSKAQDDDEKDDEMEDDEDDKSPAEPVKGKGKAKAKASAVPADEFVKLQAEVMALRDKLASREKEEAADSLVAETVESELDGYDLSPETRAHFKALAKTEPALFRASIDIYKATAERDPPESIGGGTFSADSDSPEVSAFAKHGPDALTAARRAAKDFPRLKACGMKSTLEQYLAANVDVKE